MTVASGEARSTSGISARVVDQRGHRLIFANQLRGLAACSVMLGHLIGVFWAGRAVVSAATCSPPQPGSFPPLFWLIAHKWFNFGAFGVAIFFLISGLVIPISLGAHSRLTFIAARLLRIYPTYLAAFAINLSVVWLASHYWHIPLSYPPHTLRANALLVQDWLGKPSFDLVNWTLCIELKFYLLMAVFAPAIRSGNVAVLFAIAIGALAFNLAIRSSLLAPLAAAWPNLINVMWLQSVYVVFMLIGVLFNYRLRQLLSLPAMLASIAGMLLIFVACWRTSAYSAQYPEITANYGYGLVLFGTLFLVRRWVKETRALDLLAAVSFPFYLIHSLIGYSLLKFLMLVVGLPYIAALAVTIPAILVLAAGLHVTVERWSIRMGKRLARRIPARRDELAPAGPAPSRASVS